MQPPCEIMVAEFLPNMRGLVSHELHERGQSQRRIAVLLGITQARVSYYLRVKKSTFINELSVKFGISFGDIQSYAKILSEDVSRSQVDGIFTLYSIWKNLLFTGSVCSIHQRNSRISSECSVCMDLHKSARDSSAPPGSEDGGILRDIGEAILMLEGSASFPYLIPEVSVNIAESKENPKSTRDIAAIPGRINRIHGRAKAFVLPEFGSSNHTSNVLLNFKSRYPKLRCVMNLKYDKKVEKSLDAVGILRLFTSQTSERKRPTLVESEYSDSTLRRIAKTSIPTNIVESYPFALIDRGSEGVEPMTYLFGTKAVELAQVALKLSHSYSAMILES
ncbi:MAG: thiamine-phosphate synthase family protein [Nitrososphaerales archaeon]